MLKTIPYYTIPYYTTPHYTTRYDTILYYTWLYNYIHIYSTAPIPPLNHLSSPLFSTLGFLHQVSPFGNSQGQVQCPQLRLPEVHQLHQFLSLRLNGYAVRFHRVLFPRTTPHLRCHFWVTWGFIANPSMEVSSWEHDLEHSKRSLK